MHRARVIMPAVRPQPIPLIMCGRTSSFVHVTVVPTGTRSTPGRNSQWPMRASGPAPSTGLVLFTQPPAAEGAANAMNVTAAARTGNATRRTGMEHLRLPTPPYSADAPSVPTR
jgi:hypothetical protein